MNAKIENQIVGNIGLYFVCYRLSRFGWNVMPTSRNAKGIDLMMHNADAKLKLTVQVKSLSQRKPVALGENLGKVFGDFFVVCRGVQMELPTCYILTPDEVRQTAKLYGKEYWLQPATYESFKERWDRISFLPTV